MNFTAAARAPITAPWAGSSVYAPIVLIAVGVLLLTTSAKLQIRSSSRVVRGDHGLISAHH